MAEAGRLFRVKRGAAVIGGVREEDLNFSRALVSTTNKDSDRNQEYLAGEGTLSVTANCSGVFQDNDTTGLDLVRTSMMAGTSDAYTIEHPSGDAYAGNFLVESLGLSGPTEGVVNFNFTLQSDGAVTFTPAV